MDNLPVPPAVLDAAIAWQLRGGEGARRPADTQALNDWLAAHPDHARAWRQLGEIHHQLSAAGGPSARTAVLRRTRAPARAVRAALGVALAVTCGAAMLNHFQPVSQLLADHHTGTGERRTIVLADQTVLHLNTRSAVDIAFNKDMREVRLRAGEVAVETSHANPAEQRPLVVVTEDGSLRALGTRFVVRRWARGESATSKDGGTEVTVLQSAVAARPARCAITPVELCTSERIVPNGQALRLHGGQMESITARTDADEWKDGMLVVDNQPLAEVVATLARHRPGHLGVDPAIAGLRVTGTLPLADTDQALLALTAAVPVDVAYITRWWVTLQPRMSK
ncbi:FecR domain-containing protein [Acidovorax radicis]|uniref:FecR domain-containing protein n=1 Tax=Acidovorax radicis TaxID=758826 RepID=UPI0002375116|nr:FecR family protein [Acidovorax radicis]